MAEFFSGISTIEAVAVAFSVAYLVLAIRQIVWCWHAAFIASVLSIYVFADAHLYRQSALQVFYAAMAVYGWLQWSRGTRSEPAAVHTWPLRRHAVALVATSVATVAFAYGLSFADQEMPLLDSIATIPALLATWMVARKVLENWIYWFVIDSISIYLYVTQGLMLYAALFVVYLVLVVIGFRQWLADLRAHAHSLPAAKESV